MRGNVARFEPGGDLRGCRLSFQDDKNLQREHKSKRQEIRREKQDEYHLEKVANMRALWLMPSDDRKLYPLNVNASHREDVKGTSRQQKEDADMNFTTQMCQWCKQESINKCFFTGRTGVIMEEDPETSKKKYKGGGTLALAFQVSKYLADEVEGKTYFAKANTLFEALDRGFRDPNDRQWHSWAYKVAMEINIIFLGVWVPFKFHSFLGHANYFGLVRVYPPLSVVWWCYRIRRRNCFLSYRPPNASDDTEAKDLMMRGVYVTVRKDKAASELQTGRSPRPTAESIFDFANHCYSIYCRRINQQVDKLVLRPSAGWADAGGKDSILVTFENAGVDDDGRRLVRISANYLNRVTTEKPLLNYDDEYFVHRYDANCRDKQMRLFVAKDNNGTVYQKGLKYLYQADVAGEPGGNILRSLPYRFSGGSDRFEEDKRQLCRDVLEALKQQSNSPWQDNVKGIPLRLDVFQSQHWNVESANEQPKRKKQKKLKGVDANPKPERTGRLLLSDITPVPIADTHIVNVQHSQKDAIEPMAKIIATFVSQKWVGYPM